MRIPVIVAAVFLFLFFAWNWFLYSLGFEQKVEQYDEHIALYVTNTFVRTRFRYPHYMYEENWLFMRSLSDEEQQEAVLKYGDPDSLRPCRQIYRKSVVLNIASFIFLSESHNSPTAAFLPAHICICR